jgi:hypothetical protein
MDLFNVFDPELALFFNSALVWLPLGFVVGLFRDREARQRLHDENRVLRRLLAVVRGRRTVGAINPSARSRWEAANHNAAMMGPDCGL